ncbi:glycosyltransferase, partial [Enterococcus cecorum]|uniref:glycosyltransferase n=1 Tax=Enterococcus cecorum TaxID=44008 RepID=UPI001FADB316
IKQNENFNLIKNDLLQSMNDFNNVKLHLGGHIDLPKEFIIYKDRIVLHDYVDWKELPKLISQVDINLSALKKSICNEAKSEIKWIEAALVKVVTVASNIGAFKDMIQDGKTGVLCEDNQWFIKLKNLIQDEQSRVTIADNAYCYVLENCTTQSTN